MFKIRTPYQTLTFVIPMTAIYVWFGATVEGMFTRVMVTLSGLFGWTLLEYFLHRTFFHWEPKNIKLRAILWQLHLGHHADPNLPELIFAGPLFAVPIAMVLFIATGLTLGFGISGNFMTGICLGFYSYEWIHYNAHFGRWNYRVFGYLRRYHMHHHHVSMKARFGVTSPFWDKVFRTSL